MRGARTVAVVMTVALAGCAEEARSPMEAEQMVLPTFSHQGGQTGHHFKAHMTGGEEVPSNSSRGQGQTILRLSEDGTSLTYKLIVANIQNVTQAHIHLAPAGTNGPVVAWLYPSGPPAQLIPGRTQGVLNEGVITAASLVGPLSGQPLSALVDAINAGGAYVNVHTTQFPPGEIRGQVD